MTHPSLLKQLAYYLIGSLLLVSLSHHALASVADKEIRIGITSVRDLEKTRQQWQPTADYLNLTIPGYHFSVVPLYIEEMGVAVKNSQVEFILSNPEYYILLRSEYNLAALATLMTLVEGHPVSSFGGVIFTRAERNDINQLTDLRGKIIAAVSPKSFGAYLLQRLELFEHKVEISDLKKINFVGLPQDKVITEVMSGQADVGFVRTGVLETLSTENKIKLNQLKILNQHDKGDFPQSLSTDLYPEWAFSAMRTVPDSLRKSVAKALFDIKQNDKAALDGKYYGFTPPNDYSAVEAVMLKLNAIPNQKQNFNWRDIYQKYSISLSISLAALLLAIISSALYLWRTNRHLRQAHADRDQLTLDLCQANTTLEDTVTSRTRELKDTQENLHLMLNSMSEAMYGVDINGNCTFYNAAFLHTLGYTEQDDFIGENIHKLIHHTHIDGSNYPASECRIYEAFRSNKTMHDDTEIFWRKDGSSFAIEYWARPIIKDGAVAGAVTTFRDITQRKLNEQKIKQLAFYDALTNLPNRRLLMDRLNQAFAVSHRDAHYGALLFLDLDHFKVLNDSKGHDIGDLLLIEVGKRLVSCLRDGDTVARLGGDEFVVVLETLSTHKAEAAKQAELVAEKIHFALNRPYQLKEYIHTTTPSIGIVLFTGYSNTLDDLLKFADIAMYQAKTAGRNSIRFYDPKMQAAIEERANLEAELRDGIEQQQFRLHYQIQIGDKNQALGAEVLVRWEHPQRGLVYPGDFISLAEKTELIVPLGTWIIEKSCSQLKEWQQDELTRGLTLAVNVSALQFNQVNFVAIVKRALERNSVHPSKLKLEITESMVLDNVEDIIQKMNELKLLGVSLSLDDFGTGYSSLQYLKRLPLDQIKIDQSFVRDINTDPNDDVIVRTIIAMSAELGLNVIAEGVETDTQFSFLKKYGCKAFQGYLFSKPTPIEKFEALLKQYNSVTH